MLSFVCLVACARPSMTVTKPEDALERVSKWRLKTVNDDLNFKDIAASVRQSLAYYEKIPSVSAFTVGRDQVTVLDMTETLQNFLLIVENTSLTFDEKMKRIENEFLFYRAVGSDGSGKVLFTGYYEPLLSCRISPNDVFRYPLYRKPDDIIEIDLTQFGDSFPKNRIFGRLDHNKIIPYYSREEIDQKKLLAGQGLEILWCSDPVEIYMLHVQGSGKVDLGDGNILSVLYSGSNGQPYRSIGKYLIATGAITRESVSMQSIEAYLRSNPDKISSVLSQNPSYVFFRLDSGPSLGNIGVALTPGRSIATDSKLFPKGALGFISAQKPIIVNGVIKTWIPFSRFVVNQDTGGAIKGPGRVDLFFGQGADAELTAGNLQNEGALYFLVRKK